MNKIVDESYADLIVENYGQYINENPENITYMNQKHSMLHVPAEQINRCSIGEYSYNNMPNCFTLQSIQSLERSGISQIQENSYLNLKGMGVLVGIIDTGIDYRHEAFLNQDKTTKIISIWDQTLNDGNSPNSEHILYGREYNSDIINYALSTDNPLRVVPTTDEIGHGTMLAGITVGNENLENNFRGVVPEAKLIVVKLKQAKKITKEIFCIPEDSICYQDTDILMGINYVISVANQLKRPLVICIALGTNQGGHDGRGAVSSYLSSVTDYPGTAVVIAGGNEGNTRRHYYGVISGAANYDDFQLNVGSGESGFSMEVWQSAPYRLSIEITSPGGEIVNPIFPSINECKRIGFIFETTILYVNNIISEGETGDQLILLRFDAPAPGVWKFRVYNMENQSSNYNVWLPSGNLISNNTYLLNSSPDTTLTSPGNSPYPIVVTSYNPVDGEIWSSSSWGYTRSGVIKPDLAAPGVNLNCPLPGNKYGIVSGTGAATAHASGIVAMFLEWGVVNGNYSNIYGTEIKKILIRGADRKDDLVYPNNIWGYGTINVLSAFEKLN